MGKAYHLNSTVNRFKLNSKKSVGNLNELISSAMPLTVEEWADYFYTNCRSEIELGKIGESLFQKIQYEILPEIQAITLDDCISYMKDLVIKKTFEGRRTRFQILNTELLKGTGKEFSFLPDHEKDWRFKTYQIDYYHVDEDRDLLIGIKVAPYTLYTSQNPTVIKAREEIEHIHRDAEAKGTGHFFILYYIGSGPNVKIQNEEIIEELQDL